jgi:GH25 family lysozyme M1 (1,4-beta-N-acetylmuramidase)
MTVPFIDVSNHQGVINWTQVAQTGKRGAFIKATQGTYFHDGYFPANWEAAAAQQMWRGAYHYATPGMARAAPTKLNISVTASSPTARSPGTCT